MQLNYKPASDGRLKCKSAIYHVESKYQEKELKSVFLSLKANVCDLNPALITKCITGTEQDFIMLMNRAGDYLARHHPDLSEDMRKTLMEMLSDAVFGYYVLTPLILSKEVSDIKVLAYDHIVVKANGQRYLTDVSFDSEEDYRTWYDRILRIHRLGKSEEYALNHCTDRKGVDAFYLRIDVQLSCITSTEINNLHIRKMPKEKLSWEYLKDNGILPWAVMFLLIFTFSAIVHKRFKERNVWDNIVKRYRENTDKKLLNEAEFVTRFGSIENNSILYKLDRLVLTSGIKNYLPWVTGEVMLLGMVMAAMAGFFEGAILFQNVFVAIFLTVAQAVAVYVFFKALSGKTYNEIEDGTAIFISILSNHAKGSSDIVTIMDNTIPALSGPLRGIVQKFVADAENTGNVDIAFDYMKESVDNRQLQTIIINLKNCMHYQANYEEVLVQMMGQIAAGLSAREDRKNILFSSKLTLVVISIMQVIIVWIIGAGLGIDVKQILTGNAFGQMLLLVTGLLYLMVGVKMFGTDR